MTAKTQFNINKNNGQLPNKSKKYRLNLLTFYGSTYYAWDFFLADLHYTSRKHFESVGDKKGDPKKVPSQLRYANIDAVGKEDELIKFVAFRSKFDEGKILTEENIEDYSKHMVSDLDTIVFFNGHPTEDSMVPFATLKKAFLDAAGVNIVMITVDWTRYQLDFIDALMEAPTFGQYIADILARLRIPNNQYHFIGHCIGSEVAAYTADALAQIDPNNVGRITAFDPYLNHTSKLSSKDGVNFIDVYHAGIYAPIFEPVGDVDFFPNGGIEQPGCRSQGEAEGFECSHQRSILLYAESLKYDDINAVEVIYNKEQGILNVKDDAHVVTFGHYINQNHRGSYYLPTFDNPPYLMQFF